MEYVQKLSFIFCKTHGMHGVHGGPEVWRYSDMKEKTQEKGMNIEEF